MGAAGSRSTGAVSSLNGSFYITIQTAFQRRKGLAECVNTKRIVFSSKVFMRLSLQPHVLPPT